MTFGGFSPSARGQAARLAQSLASERACERLVVAFAHALDFGRVGEASALFTRDAVFEIMGVTLAGSGEIEDALRDLVGRHPVTRHQVSSIAIHPHPDGTADGISYVTIHASGPVPLLVGHLRDRFVVDLEAGWRIAHRRLDSVFVDEAFSWPSAR